MTDKAAVPENGGERLVAGRRLIAVLVAGALGAIVAAAAHSRGAARRPTGSAVVREAASTRGHALGPTAEQEAGGLVAAPSGVASSQPAADTTRHPALSPPPRPVPPSAPRSPAAPHHAAAQHRAPAPHRPAAPPASSSGDATALNAPSHGGLGSGTAAPPAVPAPAPPSSDGAAAVHGAGDAPSAAQPVLQAETAGGQGARANDSAARTGNTAGASRAPGDGGAAAAASGAGSGTGPAAPAARVWTAPRVISTGTMEYPGAAFHLTVRHQDLGASVAVVGSEGAVTVRALVLADGIVRNVEVARSSGSDVLDRAAVEAVRGWQFTPAARDGVPQDAYVTVEVRYVVR